MMTITYMKCEQVVYRVRNASGGGGSPLSNKQRVQGSYRPLHIPVLSVGLRQGVNIVQALAIELTIDRPIAMFFRHNRSHRGHGILAISKSLLLLAVAYCQLGSLGDAFDWLHKVVVQCRSIGSHCIALHGQMLACAK